MGFSRVHRNEFAILLALLTPALCQGQTITTVAGNGALGSSGDGGPGTSASIGFPKGLSVDTAGNLYFADFLMHRVRKVSPSGTITTLAGNGFPLYGGDGGAATGASLSHPSGVAVDKDGNVYIADSYNGRIRKVDHGGTITTVAGNGMLGFSGDGGPATNAELRVPGGIAIDGSGNLYIVDTGNGRIRKVNAAGIISTVAGNGAVLFAGDGGSGDQMHNLGIPMRPPWTTPETSISRISATAESAK